MRLSILQYILTADEIEINETFIESIFDERSHYFLIELSIIFEQKEVDFVTELLIINLQLLLV
jgi:hypothetical protein